MHVTTLNTWNIVLWSFFPQLHGISSSSAGLNYPKLIKYSPIILVLSITQYFKQFGWVELPQTHKTFFYDACSLYYSIVWALRLSWTSLNSWKLLLPSLFIKDLAVQEVHQGWTPELIKYSPIIVVPSIKKFFYYPCFLNSSVIQAVQFVITTPNAWEIILWFYFF